MPLRYTNGDLKICQYLRLRMKIYVENFKLKHLLLFEICAYETFVHKQTLRNKEMGK